VTVIETRVAPVTVRDAVPVTEPDAAVIVVVPVPKLLANPPTSTEATAPDEDDQLTDDNNCVLPSSKFPTALNCSMVPNAIEELAELTEIEIRCAGTTVRTLLSL